MTKKTPYTYTILRYTHDVVTGEFVNVGVLLFAPAAHYVGVRCVNAYGRLSRFFGHLEGESFKQIMRRIESAVGVLDERLFHTLPFNDLPKDALGCAQMVLPRDDSSLSFGGGGAGVLASPESTLAVLFERYVERYARDARNEGRSDQDVWAAFRKPLQESHLLSRLRPKVIATPDYEHEFPHAWKNGVWHACEPVSFDLAEKGSIVEKANRWLGRGVNLHESKEDFVLYLLIGEPKAQALSGAFENAMNILHKMPVEHRLLREGEAPELARIIEATTADHDG